MKIYSFPVLSVIIYVGTDVLTASVGESGSGIKVSWDDMCEVVES